MFENLERLGNRRYVLPFAVIVLVFCMMSLIVYPILRATPKDVPFAVVSLDKGIESPAGLVNLGDDLVKKMTEGTQLVEGQDAPIAWTRLDSESALNTSMENNEYYGALVIPEGFSSAQAAASSGAGEALSVKVIINQGKNTMVASSMQAALSTMFNTSGIKAEFETINSANIGGGAMASMMAGQMIIMPFVMMTLACTIVLFLLFRAAKGSDLKAKAKSYGRQIAFAAVLSSFVAVFALLVATWVGGMTIPAGTTFLFLWFSSFCLMLAFLGVLSILAPLGALIIFICFGCGMSSAMLAPEMLPGFWRNWIYPWVPQHYIADGIKSILYMGSGVWNNSSGALLLTGCIGVVLMALAVVIPHKNKIVESR